MKMLNTNLVTMLALLCAAAGIAHPVDVRAQAASGGIDVAQQPLFTASGQPPLNMLVMGKDHKIYYEAYNDASDLNNDGALDIGYKPATLDYYGYFNSFACYSYSTDHFVPVSATSNKQCSGSWSGDFLNYLTTSRMDALRRVLFGGWRQVDSTTQTILQGAYFPQDGHSWGKEYQSVARDGYNISNYSPLSAPDAGKYHLFAVTTVTGNTNTYTAGYQAPLFRVLKNTDKRVWNWLSIEGPVAGNKCFTASNSRVDCVPSSAATSTWDLVPASMYTALSITTWKWTSGTGTHPTNASQMNTLFNNNANATNRCGTGVISLIDATGSNNNPFAGTNGCTHDNYITRMTGTITVPTTGSYRIGVDGDDAVEVQIDGTVVAGWYGGHGNDRSDAGLLSHSGTINLTAGTHTVVFRHEEAGGGDNWGLFLNTPASVTSRDDYLVRVETCPASNAAVREPSCKAYPNGQFKPTGILHDYGESSRMYFGLITGSQNNNLEGGVLRRNMSNFGSEIDPDTGQFRSGVNGIANSISRLRMIGGNYNGSTTNNLNSDTNWNWANGTGNCPSIGDRAINNGECRMWGNPLAEMMYESMRYYAGAAAPTARFNTGGASAGTTEETTMGLTRETWKDPYAAAPAGGGFLSCSRPFQTVISDINPSYDGDLPGSAFTGAITTTSTTPGSISGFNASSEGQAIWNSEFGAGGRSVFIGDVNNVTDGAPTAKTASSFGNIRGLAPEEPTKGGTYYSASVARFARVTDLNSITGNQNLSTYAIALASPLPRIEFPVGDGRITLLPFGKTASGTFGGGTRKPTNTIVDFYVEQIVNLPGQPFDATINGGRPYAVFRINYEDVEQGNDHDMDAIVRYLINANADGTVTVTLNSEYAAGSADQNMGFVMSGTTEDGVYLDVRDSDSGTGSFQPYALNTPNPVLPGGCGITSPPTACGQQLPLNSTRVFTPSPSGATGGATILKNPLFYAAKYGAPTPSAVDADNDGVPDNYFLVTNPATLRAQLDKAFADIIANSQPTASVATSTPRFVPGATLAYEASYKSLDWSGDIKAYNLRADATYNSGTEVWSASGSMPAPGARNVFTAEPVSGGFSGVPFTTSGLDAAMEARVQGTLDPAVFTISELIDYIKGDKSNEQGAATCVVSTDCPYRIRSSKVGDILNSTPAVIGVTSFGYGSILRDIASTAADEYPAYVEAKKTIFGNTSQTPILFVGANDGMLHAFDGRAGSGGGTELFAYIPNAVLGNLHELAQPGYVHRYFVDASPTVSDAYLGTWKTVLLASTGAGARAVFALDVSDPRNFDQNDVLWEFNDSLDTDMGQFVGRPYMGITEGGQWVAAFGNGLNSDRQRAILYIMDLETGTEVAKIDTGVGCPSTTSGCVEGPNGLATAVLVDNSGNGAADTVYAGDYQGNMWRFEQNLSSGAWALGNGGQPIFQARDTSGKKQSITSGVYAVANPIGGTMVIFGTGRYLNANDADETQIGLGTRPAVDSIYGIWDSRSYDDVNDVWTSFFPIATRTSGTYADLERQQITSYTPLGAGGINGYRTATRNPVDYRLTATGPGKLGWYLDLACTGCPLADQALIDGERVTATPDGVLSDVIFNTFRPEGDTCEPGSLNATMVLDALTGAADYIPVPPEGGWPVGQEPPPGPLVGTDTVRGPPPGEPPIVIIRPPNPGVPCLQGTPGCDPPPPECDPTTDPTCVPPIRKCEWRSPNSAGRPPGKAIPCGRISWKQIR
ncbi:PilC/PilY family type IV pilus protein [Dokdonella immobilis]|uniref:Type IV pilus assembly protein PilY1 n=1 Tax=Dokdonella immobilis TaxID=578942 RepID=A0A1I4X383_9GAMM|nr:PilC/PilY family type IV pilus protein [Dokdonella immobilis]SFN20538.1 type IV pilus assembly protein PilY1 [Dokdonella immobilis]